MSDTGNSRVRVVDRRLAILTTIGRHGSGPGELRGPTQLDVKGKTIGVLDVGNSRINLYDLQGEYRDAIRLPLRVLSFGLLNDSNVVVPDETGEHGFTIMGLDGARERRGVRPAVLTDVPVAYPNAREELRGTGIDRVAVLGEDVVVADNVTGAIGLFELGGAPLATFSPPAELMQRVFQRFRRIDESFGVRNAFTPVYNDMVALEDGRLLLLMPVDDVIALLVDPRSFEVVIVEAASDAHDRGANAGFSVAMQGREMVFAGWSGLAFFAIDAR